MCDIYCISCRRPFENIRFGTTPASNTITVHRPSDGLPVYQMGPFIGICYQRVTGQCHGKTITIAEQYYNPPLKG